MKAVLGALALLSFTATAVAEWDLIGKTDNAMAYADRSSIRTHGRLVKMWVLFDRIKENKSQAAPYWSSMYQWEFDCDAETVRSLYYADYTKKMGRGHSVYDGHLDTSFDPAPPNTSAKAMLDIACAGTQGKLTKVNR